MAKQTPTATQHQLETAQATIGDVYAHLEQQLFSDFVKRLKAHPMEGTDPSSVLKWQVQMLNDLNLVNEDTVKAVSEATGTAKGQLTELFQGLGYQVADQTNMALADATGKRGVNNTTKQVLDGYLGQTFLDLDNNVNQTLLSTNYGESAATRTFQQIIKETTADVITGLRTPEKAIAKSVYKWRDKGIQTALIDKGGHSWSLESYARMVVNTTSNRAFQEVRDRAAADYGVDTFLMSSHAACRPACAPIQGKTVTTRPTGFRAPESGEYFFPLDAFGYGEPDGTFGINCHHIKWPYIPGVNTNNQEQFGPDDAIAKGKVQQTQRELERRVRHYKSQQDLAEQMGDDEGVLKYKQLVHKNQAALRKLVQDNDFLARDYSREKVYSKLKNNSGQKTDKERNKKAGKVKPVNKKSAKNVDNSVTFTEQVKDGMTDDQASVLQSILNKAPASVRKLWRKKESQFVTVSSTSAKSYYLSGEGVRFNYHENENYEATTQGKANYTTFFHEYGHHIDAVSGTTNGRYKSSELNLAGSLTPEFYALKKKYGVSNMRDLMTSMLKNARENYPMGYNGVSDIISGITTDKYNIGWHHAAKYWRQSSDTGLDREAFAHMFAAYTMQGQENDFMMETFPKSYQKVIDFIESEAKKDD